VGEAATPHVIRALFESQGLFFEEGMIFACRKDF
jgi:hypothetical protein